MSNNYPDLSMSPEYLNDCKKGKEILEIDDNIEEKKSVGDIPNRYDPYLVDDLVLDLQSHSPSITYEKISDTDIQKMKDEINKNYMIEKISYYNKMNADNFKAISERMSKIEDKLATTSRYLYRLSSRININCVFYGGQCSDNKYKCIRCLEDDLIHDRQLVTLDQCLNCSRYEPIIGREYDADSVMNESILQDERTLGLFTENEYNNLNSICLSSIDKNYNKKDDKDKIIYGTKIASKKTEISDEINEKYYRHDWGNENNDKIIISDWNKNNNLKFDENLKDILENYINESSYKNETVELSNDNTNVKNMIRDTAINLVHFAQQGLVRYIYGAKIAENLIERTPSGLISIAKGGNQVSYSYADKCLSPPLISVDCSGFVRYCFLHNGKDMPHGSSVQYSKCSKIDFSEREVGDLMFLIDNGVVEHVALYLGDNKMAHASTPKADVDKQVLITNVPSRGGDYHFRRPNVLNDDKVCKRITIKKLSYSFSDMAEIQSGYQISTEISGNDYDWIEEKSKVLNYIRVPKIIDKNDYRSYQFLNLNKFYGATEEQIRSFLISRNANEELVRNADAFVEAGKIYNISAAYLVVHCCLETTYGKSSLSDGSYKTDSGKSIYNMYGLAAYNGDVGRRRAVKYSEDNDFMSVRKGIINGAKLIKEFMGKDQITLFDMRFNTSNPGKQQYATAINWAEQQAIMFKAIFEKLEPENFKYILPEYSRDKCV